MHSLISFNNLQFNITDKSILDSISASIEEDDRIGLVGNNGSGKTTLLKLISKENEPTSGRVLADSRVAYVKQFEIEKINSIQTVFEYIQPMENWWDILERYELIFKTKLNPDTQLRDLSGGELTKINIANAISSNPEVVLLDEPTNHLDLISVKYLTDFIKNYSAAFLIASHDVDFLNSLVSKIWELKEGKLRIFGGNYDDYKHALSLESDAKERRFEVASKEIKKLKNAEMMEAKRSERGRVRMDRMKRSNDRSTPKIILNAYKNRAQKKTVQVSEKLEKLKNAAEDNLEANKVRKTKKAFVDLKTTAKRGVIIKLKGDVKIGEKTLINDVDLDISYGDRITISGSNGSGKTILARELMKPEHFVNPDSNVLYLSQKYENLDYTKTVFENIESLSIGYEDLRKVLANYLFITEDDLAKKAKDLSGGETARLAMAKITTSEIDLLILDEPTNNLDISTIEILIEALNDFKGALLVISHNRNFLNQIGIQKEYNIENKNLTSS
ncbi:MAG: ribosomal protection-like ABC-F family protein [Candidatus Dojkabacteria bacterium]